MDDRENMLEAEDKFDSIIKMEGNYFIMDSEQLVANPFQEMQQEAISETQKKNSMTERLTSVKNNVCENHFQMAQRRLERQKTQRLKQLHDHSNRLRHEVKLLDLDRQRHNVEIQKRLMPKRDFSYDDMQIVNTEKRLGANIASFYLDKKMKYPTRLRSVSDISVTPTIRKARASIRGQEMQKSLDEYTSASRQERAATAKTSSSTTLKGSSGLARRRDSRSAPAYTRDARYGRQDKSSDSSLPAIDQEGRHEAWGSRAGNNNTQQQSSQHVKFAFENPLKILASSEESANLFARSHPYYPGMVRAVNFGSDTSDDDEDASYPSEVIDLRAILFGGVDGRAASVPISHQSLTQQQMTAIRKAQGRPPKLTTDMKQEETDYINAKINVFLENLAMSRVRTRRDSDDIFADLDSGEVNNSDGAADARYQEQSQFQSKSTSTAMTTTRDNDDDLSNSKSTSTADLLGHTHDSQNSPNDALKNDTNDNAGLSTTIKSNNVNPFTATTKTNANPIRNDSNNVNNNNNNNNVNSKNTRDMLANETAAADKGKPDTPRQSKYSWRCIRGRQPNDPQQGACSSEDLVLQALTGVPISNMLSGHVPLHSAARAMRHTATFKMHKVVEKMILDRTKYERHQVEELKRQMEMDEQQSASQPTRRTSNSSIGSRSTQHSQVAAK